MNSARALAALLFLVLAPAHAGLVFLPHVGEYGKAVPGQYAGISLYHASYDKYFGRDETIFSVANGGAYVNSVFLASAWVFNPFRDTEVPFLKDRPEICAFGFPIAQVQGRGSVLTTAEAVGLSGGNNGIGDLIALCTLQDVTRVVGPARGHLQFTALTKLPIGDYDRHALYNFATHYWTVAPQLSLHADIGHLVLDATVVHQFNGDNSEPYAAGDVPTRPADWQNVALNVGWKFSHRWWLDAGFAFNRTVGNNRYEKFHVQPARQPVPISGLCGGIPSLCNATGNFWIETRPGPYEDGGMMSQFVTAGVYYTYRSSMIVNLRMAQAVAGRGSQFTASYDVCTETPCGPSNADVGTFTFEATGVGESASVVRQPFYELRFIFPLAAF